MRRSGTFNAERFNSRMKGLESETPNGRITTEQGSSSMPSMNRDSPSPVTLHLPEYTAQKKSNGAP